MISDIAKNKLKGIWSIKSNINAIVSLLDSKLIPISALRTFFDHSNFLSFYRRFARASGFLRSWFTSSSGCIKSEVQKSLRFLSVVLGLTSATDSFWSLSIFCTQSSTLWIFLHSNSCSYFVLNLLTQSW